MLGFARASFETLRFEWCSLTGIWITHSHIISKLYLGISQNPELKTVRKESKFQGGVSGKLWKGEGKRDVFLLKQSAKTIDTELQKTWHLYPIISASQGKVFTELKSSILALGFIMQLNNRNFKGNGVMVSLQNVWWKISIVLPNSPVINVPLNSFPGNSLPPLMNWRAFFHAREEEPLYPPHNFFLP